ncbi:GNAT family N-acetyltransferase [Natronolimnobius sp. AArcel1]|uniref:GNAT family N-acetyltransferase n=1 Tax=Natronolimnobius sp. AArcel1 TaxID=1679093 RepID=UPI0013EBA5FA|nr:GNAT family N-acetyltransferase [Natronolimnobius sp. AArcel1]NGM70616.1 GNAT family N-acetyltransferase [Natronolimnobius sp. AArcel1]
MEIRHLTTADVPAALELVKQAGWNQVSADWHRLLDLEPDGCFGGYVDGDLVATTTLCTYDGSEHKSAECGNGPVLTDTGWIGMVLVHEDHRRNGYGGAIVDHALEAANDRGVTLGLDATDAGRPLYRRRGFVDVCPIERWAGVPTSTPDSQYDGTGSREWIDLDSRLIDELCAFDQRSCGVDRSALLQHLLTSSDVAGVGVRDDDGIRGYAIARPGRESGQIGPLVSSRPADAPVLLARASALLEQDAVLLDVLAVDAVADTLERLGLECQRRLTRMTAPNPKQLLVDPDVIAAAGFEFG